MHRPWMLSLALSGLMLTGCVSYRTTDTRNPVQVLSTTPVQVGYEVVPPNRLTGPFQVYRLIDTRLEEQIAVSREVEYDYDSTLADMMDGPGNDFLLFFIMVPLMAVDGLKFACTAPFVYPVSLFAGIDPSDEVTPRNAEDPRRETIEDGSDILFVDVDLLVEPMTIRAQSSEVAFPRTTVDFLASRWKQAGVNEFNLLSWEQAHPEFRAEMRWPVENQIAFVDQVFSDIGDRTERWSTLLQLIPKNAKGRELLVQQAASH